jgi:glycosyltransferase involved in cell wall biosynthesis
VSLVEDVLPALATRADRPVRVVLVGAYDPGGPVAALASHPAVTLEGFVDDVGAYYAQAAVVVAPFSAGGGTRIKLLEAFAHQVPVVSTPVGLAGLAVRDHEHVLMGESTDELASHAAHVLRSPALARSLSDAALEFVRRCHGAPVVAERVREFLHGASSPGEVNR